MAHLRAALPDLLPPTLTITDLFFSSVPQFLLKCKHLQVCKILVLCFICGPRASVEVGKGETLKGEISLNRGPFLLIV